MSGDSPLPFVGHEITAPRSASKKSRMGFADNENE